MMCKVTLQTLTDRMQFLQHLTTNVNSTSLNGRLHKQTAIIREFLTTTDLSNNSVS